MEQEKLKLVVNADVIVKYKEDDGSLSIEGPVMIKFDGEGLLSILGSVKVAFGALTGILSQIPDDKRREEALLCMKDVIAEATAKLEQDTKDILNGTTKSYKHSKNKGDSYN